MTNHGASVSAFQIIFPVGLESEGYNREAEMCKSDLG